MAGPQDSATIHRIVPSGEAQRQYAPSDLAYRVENFTVGVEGILESIVGPAPWEPDRGGGYPAIGVPHGICHASLLGGIADTLLLRHGTTLARHAGWSRSWEALTLPTGYTISSETRPRWPDQWVVLGDKIIWTNAVDRPLVVTHDGMVTPLGYWEKPSAPLPVGPLQVGETDRESTFPNNDGYSWPGRIGSVGDLLSGEQGALLDGAWYYYTQWEDIHGNLSPLSPTSAAVRLYTQSTADPEPTNDSADTVLDDLLRQMAVRVPGESEGGGTGAPEHTVAVRLYRTPDTRRAVAEPRFVTRLPGTQETMYPDDVADSELGSVAPDVVGVPVIKVMCAHRGRLVVCPVDDPGKVMVSEPGFPGMFLRYSYVYPDSGGAEVTAVASHGGRLLAFTERSTYDISDLGTPQMIAQGIGCSAPRSVFPTPGGMLVWLGIDAFYGMTPDGAIRDISSGVIHRTVQHGISRGRLRMAVAASDTWSKEYRCAVSPAGRNHNQLLLCFDGTTWRRQRHSIGYNDLCTTDDARRYMVGCGRDLITAQNNVFVLDHEYDDYDPPSRQARFRSGWHRADENALTPVYIRQLYVGQVDAFNGDVEVDFFINGSWAPVVTQTDLRQVGVDGGAAAGGSIVADIAGSAIIGTARVRDPRLVWRTVTADLNDAYTWAFEIRTTYDPNNSVHGKLRLAAFAWDITVPSLGDGKGRVPTKDE